MATAKMIETHSKEAEIYHGEVICQEKLLKLLDEFSVPRNLFQAEGAEIEEFGFNRPTGFVWWRQKTKTERKIKNIGTVYFDVEITGFIEQRHLAKITGVKGKELLFSLPIREVLVGVPSSYKVKFTSSSGISRVYPIAAFEPVGNKKSK